MKYPSISLLTGIILLAATSCEESTEPEPWSGEVQLSQVNGCQDVYLWKSALVDSFTYQFEDDLILEFFVSANCCPDSNRFDFSSEIRADTIAIAVQDTAIRNCRCTCPYLIHAEFYDLPEDHYVIAIFADTYYDTMTYTEIVVRGG